MTTIVDVGKVAGVSISTVSRVLSSSDHPVSEETRQRVLQAVSALSYSPSALARAMITQDARIIGIIVGDNQDPPSFHPTPQMPTYRVSGGRVYFNFVVDISRWYVVLTNQRFRGILPLLGVEKVCRQCPIALNISRKTFATRAADCWLPWALPEQRSLRSRRASEDCPLAFGQSATCVVLHCKYGTSPFGGMASASRARYWQDFLMDLVSCCCCNVSRP